MFKKIKFKLLKDYTTSDCLREVQKKYDEKICGLSERLDQLSRIIECISEDDIKFRLDWTNANTYYMLPDKKQYRLNKKQYRLNIYKNANEYSIILNELDDEKVDDKSYVFEVKDNIVRFEVTVKHVAMDIRYVFLIDYENRKYIVKSKTEIDLTASKEKKKKNHSKR